MKKIISGVMLILLISMTTITAFAGTSPVLPPLTDPLAIQLENSNGNAVVWNGCTTDLNLTKDYFAGLLKTTKGWSVRYQSVYRPFQYQQHLYLSVQGLSNNKLSSADKKIIQNEALKHGLSKGQPVAVPSNNAPHTRGDAFDALIYNEKGVSLNSKSFINSELLKIAKQCGFKTPPAGDYVHFEVP
jgi:hypothetical protein